MRVRIARGGIADGVGGNIETDCLVRFGADEVGAIASAAANVKNVLGAREQTGELVPGNVLIPEIWLNGSRDNPFARELNRRRRCTGVPH